jgi:uncharacterized repeat protein (TIGR03803 family)
MKRFWLTAATCLVALTTSAIAQKFTVLASFDQTSGAAPTGLVQGTDGNLYGTAVFGGAYNFENGDIFKITTSGHLSVLYSFDCPINCITLAPVSLIVGSDGNFYGIALGGGPLNEYTSAMFKLTAKDVETTQYQFPCGAGGACSTISYGSLLQASDGNFYGTTSSGGSNGLGSVFKITSKGVLTTLYSFCPNAGCTDGALPVASLVQGTDGDLYGVTTQGGTGGNPCAGYYGCGTVFKVTTGGALTTLYSFCSQTDCTDGALPYAGLVLASNGNLYGTASTGGDYTGGTVFKITPAGALKTLYNFCSQSGCTDGAYPSSTLVQGTDGNLYGTTGNGGNSSTCGYGCGTIFQLKLTGKLRTLHSFCSQPDCTDGAYPNSAPWSTNTGLFQSTNGIFYGTTLAGGSDTIGCGVIINVDGCGTVYSLNMGLGPFVMPIPRTGKVGSKIIILGNNLKGSTAVSFNGTAASFTIVSDTEITATVPTGATTGTLSVTTPGGTLNSNGPFYVLP